MSEPREVPRLALTRAEAAESLGVGLRTFARSIQPELPVVRRGAIRLIPVAAIESWLTANSTRLADDLAGNDEGRGPQSRALQRTNPPSPQRKARP